MYKYKSVLLTLISTITLGACSSSNTINSSWMADNKKSLLNKKLSTVAIPGSHYSNAYGLVDDGQKQNLIVCSGEVNGPAKTLDAELAQLIQANPQQVSEADFLNYLNTQSNNIRAQLNNGIRYLELKVCLQNANYYTSNYYLTETLDQVFNQVLDFINSNDDEIIFIDLDNNFYTDYGSLTNNDINIFHNYLQTRFGSYLMPKKDWQQLTFKDIWATKHRIIILSSNPLLTKYYDIWDKNEVLNAPPQAEYTTIKKLTLVQQTVKTESAMMNNGKLNILPIYSEFDPEHGSLGQLKSTPNDHLIIDYLYSLPTNTYLNIIVSDHKYNRLLVNYTLHKNLGITKPHAESQ